MARPPFLPSLPGLLGFLLLTSLGPGCAHRPHNAPLPAYRPTEGYYFHTHPRPENSPEILCVLAFSGGGTRAAALSYGVLEELRRTSIVVDGKPRRLLDEVDAISAVSGGSFTAAAYGLHGDAMFDIFPDAFLKRDVQKVLVWKTLNPFRWPKLLSSNWGRSDMAAAYYDQILFNNATFADLEARPGPFILINATDVNSGARFSFTQMRFDFLCSDLSSYPLSRACAASSAVPGALSPITLDNYAGDCGFTPPQWILTPTNLPPRVRLLARELRQPLDRTNHPYLHLVDGGVSDNLGLRELLDDATIYRYTPEMRSRVDIAKLKRVVIISANAYSDPERDWDRNESPPGSIATAVAAAGHTLTRFSFETLELLQQTLEDWKERAGGQSDVQFYPVMINFTNFKDPKDRRFYLNLPTSFVLPSPDVDRLVDAGSVLLRQNREYLRFVADLGGTAATANTPPGP
ncbi:MAG: patatin-like phospholipase family protein [Verrucomicrobia bacterium]|nr:patatin-like phospholipase family protein [Verrucomicrobiota bacterium]